MGKKKRSKARGQAETEAAKDELLALGSIFGDDFRAHEDGHGFSLSVVPHPGEAAANFISVELDIRYPPGYPSSELQLKIRNDTGLAVEQKKSLSKNLHVLAAQFAEASEVCAFNVVDACQEFLRKYNAAPEAVEPKPSSLWHEMQQRDNVAAGPDVFAIGDVAEPLHVAGQGWADFGFGALFQEEETTWAAMQRPAAQAPFNSESARGVSRFVKRLNLEAAELEPPPLGDEQSGNIFSTEGTLERTASSSSMVGSVLSKMRSAVRGMLGLWPPAIRQLLEKPAGESEKGEEGPSDPSELTADQLTLRKDMLLGHLLRLVATANDSGPTAAAFPAQALPSVASSLATSGLIPKWLQWAVTQQPTLFDRAFSRIFAQELAQAGGQDSSESAALKIFWRPPTSGAPAASRLQPAQSEPLSRYQSDFQEIRVLGRGAYGLAVAAVNRLDGRQYAVKKIRLQQQVPNEFSRILREVSTLARLQHTNIVRYFQAWTEMASSQEAVGLEGESELRDWLPTSAMSSSAAGTLPVRRRRASPLQPPRIAGLSPSTEHDSQEDAVPDATESSRGLWQTETAASSDDEDSEASESSKGGRSQVQMLYIQMEFCPRTLKHVLAQGAIEDEDAWQILRQILAGLAHIHAQGIIHRDLKPENIFFDSQGVLKLGDFGLAKFLRPANEQASPAQLDSDDESGPLANSLLGKRVSGTALDVTGRVGTSFYMSPEVANGWARYDAKVDLYSLGVVAFELWHPFSTGMERVTLLQASRDKGALPSKWESEHPQVAKLVKWLMEPKPSDRPSAKEVLRSNMLPTSVGDEQLSDLLRSLPEHAETLDRVVDALFSLPSQHAQAFDANEIPGNPTTGQVTSREELLRILKSVFSRHGAVPMSSSVIGFHNPDTPPNAAEFLDRSGAVLALRHEMRAPFAAWLARQAEVVAMDGEMLETMRRYEIAWVRRRAPGRALPRSYLQADLDFLSGSNKTAVEAGLLEAEAIKTVVEVLEALPETPAVEVRLGHRLLLDSLLGYIGLSQEVMKSAMEMLATIAAISPQRLKERSKHWASVRIALEGLGVRPDAISRCKQFILQIPGEASISLPRLRKKLESPGDGGRRVPAAALAAVDALEAIATHLQAWDFKPNQVAVDPLLWPHSDYLTGPLVQVHVVAADESGSSMVAAGGRYDGLLKRMWPATAAAFAPPPAAVGLTLNVKLLLPFMGAPRYQSLFPVSQADVLVCSRGGGGMLKERMALARELWAAGIRAHFLQAASPSLTAFYEFAHAHRITWLAMIERSTFTAAATVKVKNLERRTEEELPFSEVARYLAGHSSGRSEFGRSTSAAHPLPRHGHEEGGGVDDARWQDEEKPELKILNQKPRRRDRR